MGILQVVPQTQPLPPMTAKWTPLRRTVRNRLRELRCIDQRYALLKFHATRHDGEGYASIPDPTDENASHMFEFRALGLSATGSDKAELVTNYMRVLSASLQIDDALAERDASRGTQL